VSAGAPAGAPAAAPSRWPWRPFDHRAPIALGLLAVVLVGSAIGFRVAAQALSVYLSKEPVELRAHFDTIPRRLGTWVSDTETRKLDAAMVEELGTELYLDRVYRDTAEPDRPDIAMHVAYYTGMIDAVPHVPDRCLVGAGFDDEGQPRNLPLPVDVDRWPRSDDLVNLATGETYRVAVRQDPVTRRRVQVPLPVGEIALRTSTFRHPRQPGVTFLAGYFFIANGRIAVTPEQVKALAFRPQERYAYYCKVQFFAQGTDLTEEAFIEAASDLLEDLLPELMACLPDWSVIERHGPPVPDESTIASAATP